jgi:hypothetical protein
VLLLKLPLIAFDVETRSLRSRGGVELELELSGQGQTWGPFQSSGILNECNGLLVTTLRDLRFLLH